MLNYWNVLLALTAFQLVIIVIIIYFIWRVIKTPTGFKLFGITIVFEIQSIIGLIFYNRWGIEGYGKDISGPLIALQTTTLIGLLILLDIVRK